MRPDVKLGVILSSVLVLVIGSYYVFSDRREAPVPVAANAPSAGEASKVSPPTNTAKPAVTPRNLPARPANAGGQPTRRDNRIASREGAAGPTGAPGSGDRTLTPNATGTLPIRPAPTPLSTSSPSDSSGSAPGDAARVASGAGGSPAPPGQPVTGGPASPPDPAMNSRADGANAQLTANPPGSPETQPVAVQPINLTASQPSRDSGAPPAAPDPTGVVETHRVQPGDTLPSLAHRYYGDRALARFLKENNPQITDAEQLRPGDLVRIPSRPTSLGAATKPTDAAGRGSTGTSAPARTSASRPAPTTGKPGIVGNADASKPTTTGERRTYVVKAGDSFYKIAKEQLGDSSRWRELFDLNKDRVGGDATNLKIGQQIVLPSK